MGILRQVLAVVALLIAVIAATYIYVGNCGFDIPTNASTAICQVVYNYQTLLAGLFAVVAAVLTLIPVVRQLALSKLQSATMVREVLEKRLRETEARRARTTAAMQTVTLDFERDIYRDGPESEPYIQPDWAFGAQQTLELLVEKLERRHKSRVDPESVNAALRALLDDSEHLVSCLGDISLPAREPWDDPELGYSQERIEQIETEAATAARLAEVALPGKISSLSRQSNVLDMAYADVIDKLRIRIRDLDDFILATNG